MNKRLIHILSCIIIALVVMVSEGAGRTTESRVTEAKRATAHKLKQHWGKPVFIRIIKEEYLLELWLKEGENWRMHQEYPIAGMSGDIGPKQAEGDCQAPEGFYRVYKSGLNPYSSYYLSFNIGYPNRYDRSLGRTGSHIMVHGSNVSIGCFAMTNAGISEIYTLVAEALQAGQRYVPVQVYPFRMTPERMTEEEENPHAKFWQHLLPGWQHTEKNSAPYNDTDN